MQHCVNTSSKRWAKSKKRQKRILIKARKDFGLVHNNAWSQGLFLWKKKRKSDRNFCTAQQNVVLGDGKCFRLCKKRVQTRLNVKKMTKLKKNVAQSFIT